MAYGRRKKGGQRLMEMSRAGAKRKAARKAKTLAQAKANIAKGPVTRGGVKKKVAAKSTAAGRNRTALRTPRGAGSVAKKKPVVKKKPTAKSKSRPMPKLPVNMVGKQSFGSTVKEQAPALAADAALIASLLATRGRGPGGKAGTGALSRTLTRLKGAFKPKPKGDPLSVPGGRGSGLGGGKPPVTPKPTRKRTPKKKKTDEEIKAAKRAAVRRS